MLLSQKQNNRPRVVHGREAKQTPSAARKENVLFQPRRKLHRQRGRTAQLFQITPTGIWRRWVAQRSTKIRPTPAIPLKSFQASGGKRSKTFMTNKYQAPANSKVLSLGYSEWSPRSELWARYTRWKCSTVLNHRTTARTSLPTTSWSLPLKWRR